ncbi:hypothetical protein [Curtobacterium aurantiacum]|uniref:hypothetical protein n=1 Tax=Curtobacterium aurantiacum TaxID=3236919 RepID=UPI001BDFDAA1|nr:hypothetical protein [Curtobacterium flaccumfaciens]MBT1676752.1 hypothetical protein [Curtobacterium flaccumfaciens pv. flaccumfaciens]
MTAEWTILSADHVDAAAVLTGAAAVDPAIGIRQLWAGDALQLVSDDGVVLLTLLQSRRLDSVTDAERLLAGPLSVPGDRLWWTEIHTAAQPPFRGTAERIVHSIADAAGGTAASRAVQ